MMTTTEVRRRPLLASLLWILGAWFLAACSGFLLALVLSSPRWSQGEPYRPSYLLLMWGVGAAYALPLGMIAFLSTLFAGKVRLLWKPVIAVPVGALIGLLVFATLLGAPPRFVSGSFEEQIFAWTFLFTGAFTFAIGSLLQHDFPRGVLNGPLRRVTRWFLLLTAILGVAALGCLAFAARMEGQLDDIYRAHKAGSPVDPATARIVCHTVLWTRGNDYGAFLLLKEYGDKTSVPYLVRALHRRKPSDNEMQEATTGYCIEALQKITGEKYGRDLAAWDAYIIQHKK